MTDNRATEQRKMLNRLLIELDSLEVVLETPTSGMTLGEYEQEREKLLDGFSQDIAATLESGTCKLEPLSALELTLNMLSQTEWGACSECGCAVPMEARFCNECGRRVIDDRQGD